MCVSVCFVLLCLGFVHNDETTTYINVTQLFKASKCESKYCERWMHVFPNKSPTLSPTLND